MANLSYALVKKPSFTPSMIVTDHKVNLCSCYTFVKLDFLLIGRVLFRVTEQCRYSILTFSSPISASVGGTHDVLVGDRLCCQLCSSCLHESKLPPVQCHTRYGMRAVIPYTEPQGYDSSNIATGGRRGLVSIESR